MNVCRTTVRIIAAGLFALTPTTRTVLAQPSATDPADASTPPKDGASQTMQTAYDSGRTLFMNGDYQGALVKLRHAYELSNDPAILWNMIVCEKNLHHYARMHAWLRTYLDANHPRITETDRHEAQALLQAVRSYVSVLVVHVNQDGATVSVDGDPVGTTPLMEPIMVDLGSRQLQVSKPGYQEWSKAIQAAGAGEVTVNVALTPAAYFAHLAVTGPKDGMILLDDGKVGVGSWEGKVGVGRHRLRVTAPDFKPYDATLVLHENETRRMMVSLDPQERNRTWWWIAGGVVVAGAVTGGILWAQSLSKKDGPVGSWGALELPLGGGN